MKEFPTFIFLKAITFLCYSSLQNTLSYLSCWLLLISLNFNCYYFLLWLSFPYIIFQVTLSDMWFNYHPQALPFSILSSQIQLLLSSWYTHPTAWGDIYLGEYQADIQFSGKVCGILLPTFYPAIENIFSKYYLEEAVAHQGLRQNVD